jgi:SDR family mycofactocin-dependent oxidoreductase
MAGRVEGKVALITGGARGQGRSHAIRLAEEGAAVIVLDLCEQIESNLYPLATLEDLNETVRLVEGLGGRIVAEKADVRERAQVKAVLHAGVERFGGIDIVCANAGIMPMRRGEAAKASDFVDATDVDLIGVMNTVAVSLDHLRDGGSIIVTGSTAGMIRGAADNPSFGPGGAGYSWAKRILISYVEQMCLHLAPRFIRVNAVHPTNTNTHLLHNADIYRAFSGGTGETLEAAMPGFIHWNGMPIPYVEPIDISNLVLFLASDESRYISGQQIRVDAGSLVKNAGMVG